MEPDYTLIDAVESGDLDTVAAWLDLNPAILQHQEWRDRLLSAAIGQDQPSILKLLIERGVDANAQLRGGTLLHIAAGGNHPNSVRLLLAIGADPSVRDADGLLPLYYASLRSMDQDILRKLADGAGSIDLNAAVALGDLDLIRQVVSRPADGVRSAPQPEKLLKDAIWLQNSPPQFVTGRESQPTDVRPSGEIIRHLLQYGADPNKEWGNHLPPLFEALSASNFDSGIVDLLLKSGADVQKRIRAGSRFGITHRRPPRHRQ